MLTIRYLRAGRRNKAFFRIVLTDSTKPPKSGFIKVLGWYDPHTKESSIQKEEILSWLDKGAKPSNSLSKLLEDNKIKHKQIHFVKDAPSKKKKEVEPKAEKPAAEVKKAAEEPIETSEEPAEEAEAPETGEAPAEIAEAKEATTEPKEAETPEASEPEPKKAS